MRKIVGWPCARESASAVAINESTSLPGICNGVAELAVRRTLRLKRSIQPSKTTWRSGGKPLIAASSAAQVVLDWVATALKRRRRCRRVRPPEHRLWRHRPWPGGAGDHAPHSRAAAPRPPCPPDDRCFPPRTPPDGNYGRSARPWGRRV